jgi:hypothetical protein
MQEQVWQQRQQSFTHYWNKSYLSSSICSSMYTHFPYPALDPRGLTCWYCISRCIFVISHCAQAKGGRIRKLDGRELFIHLASSLSNPCGLFLPQYQRPHCPVRQTSLYRYSLWVLVTIPFSWCFKLSLKQCLLNVITPKVLYPFFSSLLLEISCCAS